MYNFHYYSNINKTLKFRAKYTTQPNLSIATFKYIYYIYIYDCVKPTFTVQVSAAA